MTLPLRDPHQASASLSGNRYGAGCCAACFSQLSFDGQTVHERDGGMTHGASLTDVAYAFQTVSRGAAESPKSTVCADGDTPTCS
jgi:hypothetical protein